MRAVARRRCRPRLSSFAACDPRHVPPGLDQPPAYATRSAVACLCLCLGTWIPSARDLHGLSIHSSMKAGRPFQGCTRIDVFGVSSLNFFQESSAMCLELWRCSGKRGLMSRRTVLVHFHYWHWTVQERRLREPVGFS